jgi:aryl-alcohol dehydrogenase-like predicted oxidoreductase
VYGESESILGQILQDSVDFHIITKSIPIRKDQIDNSDLELIKAVFKESLRKLKRDKVYAFLIHHADDLLVPGGDRIYRYLQTLKGEGLVEKIGVSVYPKDDIGRLLSLYDIDIVQLPLNVLDQRLLLDGTISDLKSRQIEIHVRSLFLQGLILMPFNELPSYFAPVVPILRKYHQFLHDSNLTSLEGAYYFAQKVPQIDAIVIGVNNCPQLIDNARSFSKALTLMIQVDFKEFSFNDEEMLNPSLWRQ